MKLHRLRLTNFRGIEDRELTFPDHGVVVVCGPNEVGKSSMLEALDLLLEYKDRSGSQKVKQVKPTHADVGAEVEAEISTGHYRFTYRKRFHRRPITELTVHEPVRRSATGDEAHDAVRAMLEETVDTRLWEAQRVLQSAATEAVNLSGSDALARALDAAAGEATAAGGTESLLIDSIEVEFGRYFTSTGRPSREWKAAIDRLAAAEARVEACRQAVADVELRVNRHEEVSRRRAELSAELEPAAARLAVAEEAAAALAVLADQVNQANLLATAAAGTSTASSSRHVQRRQLIAEVDRRSAALVELQQQLSAAVADEAAAMALADSTRSDAALAAADLDAARRQLDAARAAATACAARDEAERLAARLARIDEAQHDLRRVGDELAAIALTEPVLADIERTAALVDRLQQQLVVDAGTVTFTAVAGLSLTVDGEPLTLSAGETWTAPASAPVAVELPGMLGVRIDPGATAVDVRAKLEAAQTLHLEALAQGAVADLGAARAVDEQRRALIARRDQLRATLDVLCLEGSAEALRARLVDLRADMAAPEGDTPTDAAAAAEDLRMATAVVAAVSADADARRQAATIAAAAVTEKTTAAAVLRDRVHTAEAELEAVRGQLAEARGAVDDETVASAAAADAEAQQRAEERLAALKAEYEAANPDSVNGELAAARTAADTVTGELAAANAELATLSAQLDIIGSEGRQGSLDDAESELERARAEHTRIGGRAAAVALLRDTMVRHRDTTRQRYVLPYRTELERLGRIVFGPTFEVELDTELIIRSRTLDGRTVPYDSLSGGAKEQLGILARLAGAALVAGEDTVPVVIDDALGFTDSERLTKMGEVFDTVGDRGQVIVLTCQQDRYAGVTGATMIELSA